MEGSMSTVLRKRARLSLVAVAGIALLVLVPTATGQGKAESQSLVWKQGTTKIHSYDFGPLASGSSSAVTFKLANLDWKLRSGTVTISLTGSSAFKITANNCTGKNL